MRKPISKHLKPSAFAALGGFLLGAAVASFIFYLHFRPPTVRVLRESDIASSSAYSFTDPLMSISIGNGNSVSYAQLDSQVQSYISSQASSGLSQASVNFRDIDQSDGFTINPNEMYDPASLTKVPLAMAYYDVAENDPSVLSQQVTYSGESDLDADEQVESPVQLTPGQTYTVEDLIEHMLRYSDNNAEQLLADHLSDIGQLDVLATLFDDLGIKNDPDNPDDMTVQSYSLFLRVLYNSTYLDRDYSDKLLQLLSEGDFTQGISAGVPQGSVVAQKFGDARIPNAQGEQVGAELQDCGIIYYPNHPYILCIMTKGQSVPDLERAIAGISKLVYQNVQERYAS